MSLNDDTFVSRCLKGDCVPGQIDDYVDHWHHGDSERPLSKFLGFSPEEYALWVEVPRSLEWILYAKRMGKPIVAVLSEMNTEDAQVAATTLSCGDAEELRLWLERTGRL